VTDSSTIGQAGHPRSPADADALARFNQRMALPLARLTPPRRDATDDA
jgi:hypothetical protein